MSNTPLRLTLRQKPHVDFVIGYPGLLPDGDTKQASLEGTVEVRTQNPVHTRWLKVELKKTEVVQTSKGIRKYFELIGSNEQMLWSGAGKEYADADNYAPLDTSDHTFAIPIPPGLPPTIVLDKSKNTGIIYHLVATAMIKVKSKGLFGGTSNHFKPPTVVTQISEVTIEKHELNPTWPIYAWQAETTPLQARQANLIMRLKRETVIFGGNDAVKLDVDIISERIAPVKITRIELQLKELITTREADAGARGGTTDPKKTLQQSFDILSLKSPCQNLLYQNESMSHSLSSVFPPHHHHFTVQNAKHLDVKYVMRLRAVVEVPKAAKAKKGEARIKEEPIKEIVLDNVAVIVSPWSKKQAEWWRNKIVHIPQNLQRPSTAPVLAPPVPVQGAIASGGATVSPKPQQGTDGFRTTEYSSFPAVVASKTFNQRVNQANQQFSAINNRNVESAGSVSPQPVPPLQPPQVPQAQPMIAKPSDEERRALAIEQGKRLSSWPPPPRNVQQPAPTIAVTAAEPHAVPQNNDGKDADQLHKSLPYPGGGDVGQGYSPDYRQTRSESGHGTMYWQPSREVASLDGHSVAFKHNPPPEPYQMDGAYPMSKSASQPQGMSTMGYANPWSSPSSASHRRVFSDGGQRIRRSSQPPLEAPTPMTEDQRMSTPLLSSSIPMNNRRNSTGQSKDDAAPRRRIHVETTHGGFPTRKNTLSTITGSAPSSQQSSPTYETPTVPMAHNEWSSAEEEKERLYAEAVERARRTQERAGNTIVDPHYRSVQDRTPTPLSLTRSVSNPTPPKQDQPVQSIHELQAPTPMHDNRFSTASTHLGYLVATPEPDSSQEHVQATVPTDIPSRNNNAFDGYDPSSTRRASLQIQRSQGRGTGFHERRTSDVPPLQTAQPQVQNLQSPLSPSMSWSKSSQVDAQKMAYLRALAAREAYQQRMTGGQPQPLTALEEKQRLQRLFEEEERRTTQGDDAWQTFPKSQPPLPEPPYPEPLPNRGYHGQNGSTSVEESQDRYEREDTPPTSIYLTPDTTYGRWQPHHGVSKSYDDHNPYFESPNASSTYLPSEGSSLSQNYQRNPEISKGKQRRQSTFRSDNSEAYYESTIPNHPPPARPPKSRDILHDTYRHFDAPVSPTAEDYERKLLWGRSQSSHHGH